MKSLVSAAFLLLITLHQSAFANPYFGFQYGSVDVPLDAEVMQGEMWNFGFTTGYQVSRNFAIEGQVTRSMNDAELEKGVFLESQTRGALAKFRTNDAIHLIGEVGVVQLKYKLISGNDYVNAREWAYTYGGGIGYDFESGTFELLYQFINAADPFEENRFNSNNQFFNIGVRFNL